ncbi:EscU/YscU/HrcU family type III secretion system export apparatus switch protein [Escherichia coli]|nr:EscU/YscU/HrcU family type III secretion system export apparatus switch protein [Escherichia coli]
MHWRSKYFEVIINHCFLKLLMEISYLYYQIGGEMLFLLILYCLGSMIIVLIFDFIAEYFLFMKDMKMDKQEVKREYKKQEGNPEIKSKRRERIRKFFLSN